MILLVCLITCCISTLCYLSVLCAIITCLRGMGYFSVVVIMVSYAMCLLLFLCLIRGMGDATSKSPGGKILVRCLCV